MLLQVLSLTLFEKMSLQQAFPGSCYVSNWFGLININLGMVKAQNS